jgi:hypothetical protein
MRTNPDTSADTLPVLGAPIKPSAKPAAAPVPVAPGIVRQADGTLATNAPEPAPVWVAPSVPVVWIPTPRDEEND